MFTRYFIYLSLAVLLLAGGCEASKSLESTASITSETSILDVTSRAHKALNSGNLNALADLIDFPLAIRSHEWASMPGSFELIRPVDKIIEAKTGLLSFPELGNVKLDSGPEDGSVIPYEDVRENLEGSDYDWSELTIVIYARGFGDVEHIVLLGVDRRSGKVKALYYN